MLSPRGAFVAISGVFLLSFGLTCMGIRALADLIALIFMSYGGMIFKYDNGDPLESEDLNDPLELFRDPQQTLPSGGTLHPDTQQLLNDLSWISLFDINITLVNYVMLLGTIMLLAAIIGLPIFRISSNATMIRITRHLDREKAFSGEFVHVTVKVTNASRRRFDFVEIFDGIPETMELTLGENFIVTQLGRNETKEFSYILRCTTRGVFRIGPTKVIIHDRLGFYFEEDTREVFTEVLTYPSYEDIRRMDALAKKRQIGRAFGTHKTKIKGMGDDFHSLRKYFPGDEVRKVDWKAFGRRGELMVRVYEAEQNIRTVVFLDHSGSMGGGIPNNTKLDFGIRSAMLLSHMCSERRDLFGLCTYADRPTSWMEPSAKPGTFFELLETLALVEPIGRANPEAAVRYVIQRMPRPSFFIFITDLEATHPEIFLEAVKAARAAKNDLVVLAPFGPLFEAKIGDLSPTERALAEAISEEYMGFRKVVEDGLKGFQVDVVNVGPGDMLPQVIKQYMEAKQAGRGVVA
ncbi:MAG: DUF58 domain-containing protein [Promethearchaeota archaeon]